MTAIGLLRTLAGAALVCAVMAAAPAAHGDNPPIYIAFLWHLHQPVYVPYQDAFTTVQNNGPIGGPSFSFSLHEMWSSKGGPYRTWPIDAVEAGMNAGLEHLGAQVNFTGSLIESLNNLEYNGWNGGFYSGWKSRWMQGASWLTPLGNPRVEVIGFPFHHPIAGLAPVEDLALQIELHRRIYLDNFGDRYSKGCFPAETAFHERMIPALVDAGLEWVIVDSIHLDRTLDDYPWTGNSGVLEPNGADKVGQSLQDVDPGSAWIQLNGLWAPEKVSAWAHRPHYLAYTDPETGEEARVIVVPGSTYLGNEDARGGFGALNYEGVLSQLEPYNTDPDHPLLVVLHHDGENYGAGSESYYHANFQRFVEWCLANSSRFVPITIQDYLDLYPPDPEDVVHAEPGGWVGAGCLSPEFQFWLGDPDPFPDGYSPDWISWAVIIAAHNWLATAQSIAPWQDVAGILYNSGSETERAFRDYLCAQASDYEYWEGGPDEVIWNANAIRGCNLAVERAQRVVSGGSDTVGPSILRPQRQRYNPGGTEWGEPQPTDFQVWTFIYDISGVESAVVRYRVDPDGRVGPENRVYAGGTWGEMPMTVRQLAPQAAIEPLAIADLYMATLPGSEGTLVDYYVEARDSLGNVRRSEIEHVYVGAEGAPAGGVTWFPLTPSREDQIRITVHDPGQGGWLHWGVNAAGHDWQQPDEGYWPPGSQLYQGVGPAVESPLEGPGPEGEYTIDIGPFNLPQQDVYTVDFVIHFQDDTWDNNDGEDYHITIWETPNPSPTTTPTPTRAPTSPASPTPPPTGSPQFTATPEASPPLPSPTATEIPGDLTVELRLNHPWFTGGDRLVLSLRTENRTLQQALVDQYVVLEVLGSYFFHPSWGTSPESTPRSLPPRSEETTDLVDLLLPTPLPAGGPFFFHAALLHAGSSDLASNVSTVVFGFY
jgi:hypothetical protein